MNQVTVFTHTRVEQTAHCLDQLIDAARRAGVQLRFDPEETKKHGLEDSDVVVTNADVAPDADLAIVLGGDGTILKSLRRYAGTEVPTYAVNFGEVGFLATIDPDEVVAGFDRALSREFEVLRLPAIAVTTDDHELYAMNDVSVHRKAGERVAQLGYGVAGDTVASVRCDGLVIASPAGSTGYNLANGGPVMAWGVEGYVVSFIAPHSMTARPLVVAPHDVLEVANQSRGGTAMDIHVDGRPAGELDCDKSLQARFVPDMACLAQEPGSSFYRRLRDKFGRLST
ncbi:MAG: NAD(+)/NADH kinase [Solirubrobacteraceae bacterium]